MPTLTEAQAITRAHELLAARPGRVVLGIAGAPGAGKSHLSSALVAAIPDSVVLGMDAFHLAHSVLTARGDVERKGAPETFDAHGYVALLQRVRHQGSETIWAPEFRREVEDAIAGAVEVAPATRLVITEGNYLLLDTEPWNKVPGLCDEVWFAGPNEDTRIERLVARHIHYGRSPADALRRATRGTDVDNAALVSASRHRADAEVRL